MVSCPTCGNEIALPLTVCPYCEQPVGKADAPSNPASPDRLIATANLKEGLPTVEVALKRLDREISKARSAGVRVLRVIHGYGSKGSGGAIKQAVQKRVTELAGRRALRAFVAGEDYSKASGKGRDLLARFPSLASTLRTDRGNPGITFLEL